MSTHLKWMLALVLPLIGPIAPAGEPAAVRESFIAAMHGVRLSLPDTPDSPALEAFAIHDYLVAARLRRDLVKSPGEASDAMIDAFLGAHAGQPVTHGLRHDWLASLAQRQRWEWFLPRSADASDPQLVCDRLEGRMITGDMEGLGDAALERWSMPQKHPAECNHVFAWLRQQNLITPALAESKVRALLAADNPHLARDFMEGVPNTRIPALLQWSDLLETPKATLTVLAGHPALACEPDALGAGFEKLAHTDSAAALDLLPQLLARQDSTPELRARLARAAALGAAYDRDPRALAAFDALAAPADDSQVAEWRVRAALWAGDFGKSLASIERMPAGLATLPRWRYWRARATAATAGADAAAPLFAQIAAMRDFYGYLASDRLHRSYDLNARHSPDDLTAQEALAGKPGMIRAHELFLCDMPEEAAVEWTLVVGASQGSLARDMTSLVAPSNWNEVEGRASVFTPRSGAKTIDHAVHTYFIPTESLTPGNLRLIAAGFMSANLDYYVAMVLIAAILLGLATRAVVKVHGNRS